MAAIEGAVVLVGLGLELLQFGLDNFAPQQESASVVRVAVGLDTPGHGDMGGDLPDVRLFDENGDFLAMKQDPGQVGSGGFNDITIEHTSQATYSVITANSDAICVAFVSIIWPDGSKYAWTGDLAKECYGDTYYSNTISITATMCHPIYESTQLWIGTLLDSKSTGQRFLVVLRMTLNMTMVSNFPLISTGGFCLTFSSVLDYYCNRGPPFKMFNDYEPYEVEAWVHKNPETTRTLESPRYNTVLHQRANGTYNNSHSSRLVVSNSPSHPAQFT